MRNPLLVAIVRYAGRLRFPTLFLMTVALFALNVIIPDPLPFVDEMVMALATLLLGSMRARKTEGGQAEPEDGSR